MFQAVFMPFSFCFLIIIYDEHFQFVCLFIFNLCHKKPKTSEIHNINNNNNNQVLKVAFSL